MTVDVPVTPAVSEPTVSEIVVVPPETVAEWLRVGGGVMVEVRVTVASNDEERVSPEIDSERVRFAVSEREKVESTVTVHVLVTGSDLLVVMVISRVFEGVGGGVTVSVSVTEYDFVPDAKTVKVSVLVGETKGSSDMVNVCVEAVSVVVAVLSMLSVKVMLGLGVGGGVTVALAVAVAPGLAEREPDKRVAEGVTVDERTSDGVAETE